LDIEKLRQQFIDRVTENYADFTANLLTCDRQVLIDNADSISAMKNTYQSLMQNRTFQETELNHLLQFVNPLEVVAHHGTDFALIGDIVKDLLSEPEDEKFYPLVTDAKPKEPLRKFMNVDVIASLQSIMEQVTVYCRADFDIDRGTITRAALSEEPEKRNLLWLCRQGGTHLHTERDVFIKGTKSHNNIQFYHRDCQSEKAVLYSVEITGVKNGVVRGNIYERDRHQYAELAFRGASPYTDVTLTFISGRELRIPQKDFVYPTQQDLEYEHGKIMEVRNEPEDESVVQGALRREHERRERLPKGRFDAHVQKLADQRVQAEADRITSALEKLTEPNSPKKDHFMVPLSPHFIQISSTGDMDALTDKLGAHFPAQAFYFQVPDGEKMPHFFIKPEAVRPSVAERKPSIKEQLAAPPVQGDKQPSKKKQDREVR